MEIKLWLITALSLLVGQVPAHPHGAPVTGIL